ncbi:MAG TPA: LLM class flavin-dependent oxidoreductase [Methylomirabilota bacterium]|jgi:probable F420-dependent oxidoreductase|nr:LLM class flavin-dependent oxidoreductase [Methylomirabilota bacterium]
MAKIEFGTALPSVTGTAEFARQAEELGYDFLGCGEHVMFYGPVSNTFISLSVAAGVTKKIKLLSSVVLLPLYPAALVAKMGAALDVASGGRYNFGVGIGGEFPKEFEACGVPVNQRGARTNEALEVITKLWTEKNVTFDGKFTKLNGVSIEPAPLQKPRPPIWVAGRKEPAMKRTAKYADGWLPYMYTPQQLHESIEKINTFGKEHGRDMSAFTPGVFIFAAVHQDGDRARQMCSEKLSKQYNQDFSKLIAKYALAGTPEECQKRLREYIDAGAKMVMLPSACSQEYVNENTRLLAKEVIPAFR